MEDFISCPKCRRKVLPGIRFCPNCGYAIGKIHKEEKTYPDDNPFEVLQVSPDAEIEVIEAAYKSLAKKYHPESSQYSNEKMAKINWAYGILKDEHQRKSWKDRSKNKQHSSDRNESKTWAKSKENVGKKTSPPQETDKPPTNDTEKSKIGMVVIFVFGLFICLLLGGAFNTTSKDPTPSQTSKKVSIT